MLPFDLVEVGSTVFVALSLLPFLLSAAKEPGPDNDYGRDEIWGNDGIMPWTPLLEGNGLEGWDIHEESVWSREGDTIVASPPGDHMHGDMFRGDGSWENYELKVQACLVDGAMLQIQFRKSDAGFYQLGLLPGLHAFQIGSLDPDGNRRRLDVVNHVMERDREYHILIAVRGHSITSYIDGQLVNRVTDDTHSAGGVAFGVWGKRTAARFRAPMVRLYE